MLEVMDTSDVRLAQAEDQDRAVDVIVPAFVRDPFARWVYPEAHLYLSHGGTFTRAFGGRAFEHDSVYQIAELSGAALWLPPGVAPDDEALIRIMESSVAPPRLDILMAVFDQMGSYHPAEPHWHLPLNGWSCRPTSRSPPPSRWKAGRFPPRDRTLAQRIL